MQSKLFINKKVIIHPLRSRLDYTKLIEFWISWYTKKKVEEVENKIKETARI